jgi:hypothetical protein
MMMRSTTTIIFLELASVLALQPTDAFTANSIRAFQSPLYATNSDRRRPHRLNVLSNPRDFRGESKRGGFDFSVDSPSAEELDLKSPFPDVNGGYAEGDQYRIRSYERQEELSKMSAFAESLLRWSPVLIPILAYQLYDPVAELFAGAIDSISNRNWVSVDGGAYQAKIIAPAINGVIVPSISLLFANLIGNTVSTLRQRQLDIRTTINMEAGQLRILQSLIESFPQGVMQDKCRYYMVDYISRLISEGHETVNLDASHQSGMDSELFGVLNELNRLSSAELVPTVILDQSYGACNKLSEHRSKRITALQSTFPALHYIIVTALALSICIVFLMETDQDILVFLNAVQLRILWTMLTGTFCALALVVFDLGNPFRGSYEISKSVDQLYIIRDSLRSSLGNNRKSEWVLEDADLTEHN